MNTVYVITRLEHIFSGNPKLTSGAQTQTSGSRQHSTGGTSKTTDGLLCCCLLEEGRLSEVHIDQEGQTLLGNIYVGKVKNVLKNIDAAFVEIAGGQICFLPRSEAQHPILVNRRFDGRILAGDEILVQVQKDAVKTKDPVLTAKLSITGTYASVSLGEEKGIRYSHKLSSEEKALLRAAIADIRLPEDMTAVIRTQSGTLCHPDSGQADLGPLKAELLSLFEQAQRLLQTGRTRTVFSLLTENIPGYVKRLKTLRSFPDKIITDKLSVFQTLKSCCQENDPDKCDRLSFYRDQKLSLAALYGLSGKFSEVTSRTVWLKSGGYLVIEPTEALTVIDVNTGKYTGKRNTEETFFMINEEAALEVARQLRLRNLSGIIVVDFINMAGKEASQKLLSLLKSACRSDPVPVQVVDMTPLGLVEITRKKISRPLSEQLREFKQMP